MSSLQEAGTTLWIEVQVGSEQRPVQNVFGVSFTLTYDTGRVTIQGDEAGEFLGEDVVYSSNVDEEAGEVGIGVSRKSGDGGVEGAGTVARVQIRIDSDAAVGDTLEFEITDVSANDPSGNSISLDTKSGGLTVGTAIPMQPSIQVLTGEADGSPAPGDTIAVDVTVGTDRIPVSDLFGTGFTLGYDPSKLTVLNDTTGPFLGTDLVYSANVDSVNGEVGVGVSRKAGAEGVDGAGSVARVTARVNPTIAEGETLSFGLTDAQARNSADSSIAVTTSDTTVTIMAEFFPPTVRRDTARVRRGGSQLLKVLANDGSNRGLDSASVSIATAPRHGSASVNAATGTIAYVHDGSEALTDSLAYTVADIQGQRSEPATAVLHGVDARVEEGRAARGEAAPIEIVVEGDFFPTEARLYVRRGGGGAYRSLPLTQTESEPLRLSASVPDTLVTTRGVDYYAVLSTEGYTLTFPSGAREEAEQRPRHLPVSFETWSVPFTPAPETYGMVSIPAQPANGIRAALKAAYGPYDRSEWRLTRWDPTAENGGSYREYPQLDTLRAGQGMWLITSGGEGFTLSEGQTVDASSPRGIAVHPGWNQIGNPFGFSVSWDSVLAASGLSASEVDGPVAYRDSGEGRGRYQYGQNRLEPWEGYFVRNRTSQTDTLRVPPIGAQKTASKARASSQDRSKALRGVLVDSESTGTSPFGKSGGARGPVRGYTVEVEAQTGEGEEHRVWLGLRSKAKAGPDALDFAQAPPIGRSVRLSVMGKAEDARADRAVRWAGSFKPMTGEGRSWRLAVTNRSEEAKWTVRLRLTSQGRPPKGQKRYLLDLKHGRRMVSGRELVLDPGEMRTLKVIVGTESYAKQNSEGISMKTFRNDLRGNYPNPFGGETTIEYVLASEQEVTIRVYNILGQRVQTLVEGTKKAGRHAITWEGENRYGTPVGSGVYFYRIEADGLTETQKMVLMR